jgi:hypothetical protein
MNDSFQIMATLLKLQEKTHITNSVTIVWYGYSISVLEAY